MGIAYLKDKFILVNSKEKGYPVDKPAVTTGRIDIMDQFDNYFRILTTHQRGGRKEQLDELFKFSIEDINVKIYKKMICIICGDFNEDFGIDTNIKGYSTIPRDINKNECLVSRPPHKQDESQRSGKGKVD